MSHKNFRAIYTNCDPACRQTGKIFIANSMWPTENKNIHMKQTKSELNVDFIGGQGPLTKNEAEAISEYIKVQKAKREKKPINRARRVSKNSRNKITA